jgi:hypothetical protein
MVLLSACKKEIEKIVVQDRQYSWSSDKRITDSFGILLGAGKGPTGLYFQQPVGFAALENQGSGSLRYTQYLILGLWQPNDALSNRAGVYGHVPRYDGISYI